METDPKGQLGGLESSDVVRRRLATESQAFRCLVCGKTNSEILNESAQAAKSSPAGEKEVVVPHDLKMGWKDEMDRGHTPIAGSTGSNSLVGSDSERLMRTDGNRAEKSQSTLNSNSGLTELTERDRVRRMPSATPTESRRSSRSQHDQVTRRTRPAEAVPSWVDWTILVLAMVLAVTLAKLFFNL